MGPYISFLPFQNGKLLSQKAIFETKICHAMCDQYNRRDIERVIQVSKTLLLNYFPNMLEVSTKLTALHNIEPARIKETLQFQIQCLYWRKCFVPQETLVD